MIVVGLVQCERWPAFNVWLGGIRPKDMMADPMQALAFLGG